MALTLGKCARCGRVYNTRHDLRVCTECHFKIDEERSIVESSIDDRKSRTLSEVAADTRLPKSRVQTILRKAPFLARGLEPEGSCSQCGGPGALASWGRCIGCQLALYASLGDGAFNLSLAKSTDPVKPSKAMNVLRAVQDKRRRTGSYRFFGAPRSGNRG